MNVLSLFDGMSCGQIALTELGCFPDKYYASEVDKFAIQQTMHVFPDTIQIGDVTKVDVSKLDKPVNAYRVRAFADRTGIVRVDSIRHTDIPDVWQRVDGEGYRTYIESLI